MADRTSAAETIAGAMTLGSASGPEQDFTRGVYGALLVTALIAAQWSATPSTAFVAASLVASVVVYWLAHVWSAIVNERLQRRFSRSDIARLGRGEAPMLAALVLPAVVLVVGDVIGADAGSVINVALVVSVGQLFFWGLAVGRADHYGWLPAIRVATVDCLFGLVIVALKVFVLH